MKERTCKGLDGSPCIACQLINDAKIQAELSTIDIVDKLVENGWKKLF